MLHRLKALCLLLVVGLVIPMSGAPLRFCMAEFQFATKGGTCAPCEQQKHCDCSGDENPLIPGCIAGAKLLPDGVQTLVIPIPAPLMFEIPTPAFLAVIRETSDFLPTASPRDRSPPGPARLYLTKRSLLL